MEIHYPVNPETGSKDHAWLLKVCTAAALTNSISTTKFTESSKKKYGFFIIPDCSQKILEANAIVRYLLSSSRCGVVRHNQAIEWEETFLREQVALTPELLLKFENLLIETDAPYSTVVPRTSDVILYCTFHSLYLKSSLSLETQPVLKKWYEELSSHRGIVDANTMLEANVNLRKLRIVANETHRKIDQTNIIDLSSPAQKGSAKLPIPGQENYLITSALPYVNNVPHLGNIIGAVLSADVFARFCKISGFNYLYICGTDEYGTATETKALQEGISCQALCDKYHKIHSDIYQWFEIEFDYFGRTCTPQQTKIAQDIFLNVHRNGHLRKEMMVQLYCEHCNRFLADRYVEGICPNCKYDGARGDQCDQCGKLLNATELVQPRCTLDGNSPILRNSEHLFLDLEKLQPLCEKFVEKSSTEGNWTTNSKAITNNWLKDGLLPRCITRDLKWGTKVPLEGFENKVFYVWFDAPIGYLSITANYTEEWEKWWRNPEQVKLYQFMGKDNVPFHTVVFPCSLIADGTEWTMLHHINTTEYLSYEDGKFSKSRNTGVFGDQAETTGIPSSVWRYYLLSSRPESNDSMFTWKELISKNNNELLANIGNFCNRVVKFTTDGSKYDAIIPVPQLESPDLALMEAVNQHIEVYTNSLKQVRLRAALKAVMDISQLGNVYLQEQRIDNTLFKQQRARCDTVISLAINLVYLLASLVYPFMPSTAESIWRQLNAPPKKLSSEWKLDILPGHRIGEPEYLFKRIEPAMEAEWKRRFGGSQVEVVTKAKKTGAGASAGVKK